MGSFAALLASPHDPGDQKRLRQVGSTISTLVTGYILAKIVDPVIAVMMHHERLPLMFEPRIGANVLVTLINFFAGFLLVYQYRVYVSGEMVDENREHEGKVVGAKL